MVPSAQASDNYQSTQYQGAVKTIASCGACHSSSRGDGLTEYLSEHGWLNPQRQNGCNICHTQITTTNTTHWPHQYEWKDSNSTTSGSGGGSTGGGGGSVSPASSATITPSSGTVTVGKSVTFTASASGGSGTYESLVEGGMTEPCTPSETCQNHWSSGIVRNGSTLKFAGVTISVPPYVPRPLPARPCAAGGGAGW